MFLEFSWVNVVFWLVITHITILTVTIYLHRSVAHRSLTLSKPLEHFFRFWNWMTTGQSPKEWASVHRKHHAFCEKKATHIALNYLEFGIYCLKVLCIIKKKQQIKKH